IDLSGDKLDTIVVSEENIADNTANSSANFSGAFKDIIYGADGKADEDELTFELVIAEEAASGLSSLSDESIKLHTNSAGAIEGRVDGETDPYFTISVDQSGNVTLTQHKPIQHPDKGRVGEFD